MTETNTEDSVNMKKLLAALWFVGALMTPMAACAEASPAYLAPRDSWKTAINKINKNTTNLVAVSSDLDALEAYVSTQLASNVWAEADAATNYVRRTGDRLTGNLYFENQTPHNIGGLWYMNFTNVIGYHGSIFLDNLAEPRGQR